MSSLEKVSQSHIVAHLCPTIECDLVKWLIWAQELMIPEPILTKEFDSNQEVRESDLVQ